MAGKKISELQALTTLTGEEELPVAINGGNWKVTSSLLVNEIKTAQSGLLSRVNDYMYDMSGLLGKLVYKGMFHSLLDQFTLEGYYDVNGELREGGDAISTPKMDIIDGAVYHLELLATYSYIYPLNLYDNNGKLLYNSINTQRQIEKDYIFAGASKISLTIRKSQASTSTVGYYDLQDTSIEGNRALYVAAGAVYNQNTGFYELNGLTDITEEQMREIYVQTNPTKRVADLCSVLNASSIRTNFTFLNRGGYKNIDCYAAFANCTNLEVVAFGARDGDNFFPSRIIYAFINCIKLREIKSVLNVTSLESHNNKFLNTFSACRALEKILILNLKDNISFPDSPLLSLESLQYLITNAANTSPITVTVHADVYAKIQDEGQVDWHALIETAAAKQITFATA